MEAPKGLQKTARLVESQPDLLLGILVEISSESVYDRIYNCPTYPLLNPNEDISTTVEILDSLLSENPEHISDYLALLFQRAVDKESRKASGQYFTPSDKARWVVDYINLSNQESILDPGSGTGVFASEILREGTAASYRYTGIENNPILALASAIVLERVGAPEDWQIIYSNYFNVDLDTLDDAAQSPDGMELSRIISNPPFIRYQKIGSRHELIDSIRNEIGLDISGYAGVHSFFLAHSVRLMEGAQDGRQDSDRSITFILPPEFEGTEYGSDLIHQLENKFGWRVGTTEIPTDPSSKTTGRGLMTSNMRRIFHFSPTGSESKQGDQPLSRSSPRLCLGDVAEVQRGISTGANSFFILSDDDAREFNVPDEFRARIIPTKISIDDDFFTRERWENLRADGEPCWLLRIPDTLEQDELNPELRDYLNHGMASGVHMRDTCRRRDPWYSIRPPGSPPDLIYTYVSQGDPRFIFNQVEAHVLTNLLGVRLTYVNPDSIHEQARIVKQLNERLADWIDRSNVGRWYDRGLYKIEPGELATIPLNPVLVNLLYPGYRSLDSFS